MPATTPRRFDAKQETTTRDLVAVMRKMNATNLRVEQDLFKGHVTIRFDRKGQRYVFESRQYQHGLDNLRAAQLTIEYLWRALEQYGVTQTAQALDRAFAQFFLGFEAAPDDMSLLLGDGSQNWYDVLGVQADADKATITNAYRSMAKIHHPDTGGDAETFKRLRAAYDQGVKAREGKP